MRRIGPAEIDNGSLKREQIESLHDLGFVERRENVIFPGPPGVGKTHLSISLAIATAQHGRRVYYGTLADLIASLEEAQAAGRLQHRLKVLTHPALLIVEEICSLPVGRSGADRPRAPPLPHRQHLRQQLPDAQTLKTLAGPPHRPRWGRGEEDVRGEARHLHRGTLSAAEDGTFSPGVDMCDAISANVPRLATRRAAAFGGIRWKSRTVWVTDLLARRRIGLERIADDLWAIYFGTRHLGWLDESDSRIMKLRRRSTLT